MGENKLDKEQAECAELQHFDTAATHADTDGRETPCDLGGSQDTGACIATYKLTV